jgi:threonine/homoserine/homoserine lactone efflux protein
MSFEIITAVAVFATVASITPGPNNTMLLASGLNFGFVRSLPHMFGITIGFSIMIVAVGLGLSRIFEIYPTLHHVLFVFSALYLLYLAWMIAISKSSKSATDTSGKPFTFLQAAAFQWVNPKAWVMAIGVTTGYVPHDNFTSGLFLVTGICALVNFPCIAIWAGFGAAMQRYLSNERHRQIFNITLAVLLVLSVLMSVYEGYVK